MGMPWNPALATDELIAQCAQWLLCAEAGANNLKKACGLCKSCLLWDAQTHPDYHRVGVATDTSLGVDAIRQLQKALHNSAHQGGNKVAVIAEAEKLTPAASNALLKTLEEPPRDTFIIVASARFSQLLPTLRSRLQFYPVAPPTGEELASWLQHYGQQPVAAEPWLDHWCAQPLNALARLQGGNLQASSQILPLLMGTLPGKLKSQQDALALLDELEHALRDLSWLEMRGAAQELRLPELADSALVEQLHQRDQPLPLQSWLSACHQLRRQLREQSGLNHQLALGQLITSIQQDLGAN
jgi:DNA polymerase-3 subunit delta'